MIPAVLLLLAGVLRLGLTPQAGAAPAQPDPPVRLTLRLGEGRTQFRIGERIPLELEFGSTVGKRFVVDGATDDGSGRLAIDDFHVDPADAVTDPMADYFAGNRGSIGGIRNMGVLGETPFVVKLDLNEWVRFERSGTFQLVVRTQRVTDEASNARAIVPVTSNRVSFEILPRDPAWEVRELTAAGRILDAPSSSLDRRNGCRLMRFLGTDAAVDEMIRRYGTEPDLGCDVDYMAGLFGATNRPRVVKQMEAALVTADQPVTNSYLRTLATLSVYANHPEVRPDPSHGGQSPAGADATRHLIDAAFAMYSDMLIAALPQKTDRARAMTLAEREALVSRVSPAAAPTISREQLAAVFLELPAERQETLLGGRWSTLATPAMIPALRQLVESSTKTSGAVVDLALRRLYESAPDQGRPLILREIQHPRRAMTLETLGRLPDAELPGLDDVLAANFEASGDLEDFEGAGIRAELVHRYASQKIADRILDTTTDRLTHMACRSQSAILAYFLRVDDRIGRALLDRALTSRESLGCRTRLALVADLRMTAVVEARAIADLDDADPDVVIGALETLQRHGSPSALAPLRMAFERWHAKWDGRESELHYSAAADQPNARQAMVEDAFRQALGLGQGWLTERPALRELRELCVTSGCRTQVSHMIDAAADSTISILQLDEPVDSLILLAQYQFTSISTLEQKLAQYPRATTFGLKTSGLDSRVATEVTSEIEMFARAHGIVVNRRQ